MTKYRWLVLAFAFIAIIITYLDRMALSYAITPLEKNFGLTNADFGIIAAAFGVGYMIMTVVGGIIIDRFGALKGWSWSAIIWSLMCALIGAATGFWSLFIFRLLLGVAEGPSFPALTRVATDWLPISERARALAFGLAAVPFASVIGAPLISYLITLFNWRVAFYFLGILGILWAMAWLKVFKDQPQESAEVSPLELQYIQDEPEKNSEQAHIHEMMKQKTSWKFMLFNPAFLINNYAFFAFGYLLFFALTWLPGFLEQTYHIQLKQVGIFLIAPWLVATFLLLLCGFISDYLYKKTRSIRIARSHLIWICQIISVICFIPVVMIHSLKIAIIFVSLGVGFGMMPNCAFYAINSDLARDRAATSLGIMDSSFAAAGILSPLLTGWLSTISGNFNSAIYLVMGLTLTSALAIIFFQKPDEVLLKKQSYC